MHTILHSIPRQRILFALETDGGRRVDDDHMVEGIYDRIKARLLARALAPGQLLQIGALAEELGVSTTPVREALTRLAAERLIVFAPKKGFFAKIPSEEEIRGLYCVSQMLLESALSYGPVEARVKDVSRSGETLAVSHDLTAGNTQQLVQYTAELFLHMVARAGIGEYVEIVRNANDRLHQPRIIECEIVGNVSEELAALGGLYTRTSLGELRTAIREYHARRLQLLPTICKELLFRPFSSGSR
ncbi:MAG: GntR family transcriptional regulator [Steroidobacter sp.]